MNTAGEPRPPVVDKMRFEEDRCTAARRSTASYHQSEPKAHIHFERRGRLTLSNEAKTVDIHR